MLPLERFILKEVRAEIIPFAAGDVLEVGIGTGANCAYYDYSRVRNVTGLDVTRRIDKAVAVPFRFVESSVEALPFEDQQFDSVVGTLFLCSVADVGRSLREIERVLKPGGTFIFLEHIRPRGNTSRALFTLVNAIWPKLAHGCSLTKDTDVAIRKSGLAVTLFKERSGGIFCYGTAEKTPCGYGAPEVK